AAEAGGERRAAPGRPRRAQSQGRAPGPGAGGAPRRGHQSGGLHRDRGPAHAAAAARPARQRRPADSELAPPDRPRRGPGGQGVRPGALGLAALLAAGPGDEAGRAGRTGGDRLGRRLAAAARRAALRAAVEPLPMNPFTPSRLRAVLTAAGVLLALVGLL